MLVVALCQNKIREKAGLAQAIFNASWLIELRCRSELFHR